MRSHTGAVMTMGRGAIQFISSKQKMNTRSSTEAELVAVDDVIAQILPVDLEILTGSRISGRSQCAIPRQQQRN